MTYQKKRVALFGLMLLLITPGLRGVPVVGQRASTTQTEAAALESSLPADALGVILVETPARLKTNLTSTAFFRLTSPGAADDTVAGSFRSAVERFSGSGVRLAAVYTVPDNPRREPPLAIVVEAPTVPAARSGAARVAAFYPSSSAASDSHPSPIVRTTVQVDGEPISFAHRGRLFVYGQDPAVAAVEKSLDGGSSLCRDPSFQAARQASPAESAVFAYLNFGRLVSYGTQRLQRQMMRMDLTGLIIPMLQFAGVSAIQGIGLSTRFQDRLAKDEIQVLVNWNQAGLMPAILALPPVQSRGAETLPASTVSYVSFTVDANQIYEALLKSFGPLIMAQLGAGSVEEAITGMEQKIGFRIKQELLAALGNEVVIAGLPPNRPRAGASSDTVVLLAVKDPDLLIRVVEKTLAQRADAQSVAPDTYKTHKIYPLVENLGISVVGSFALIANRDQIRSVIDESIEKKQVLASRESHRRALASDGANGAIRIYVGNEMLARPRVVQALSGSADGPSPFVRSLQPAFDPLVYGTGRRNEAGIALQMTSPLGVVLSSDFFNESWKQEVGRLSSDKAEGPQHAQPPVLSLLSFFSRVFASAK